MSNSVFELFRAAILGKKRIACVYAGHERLVCPHALGYSKTGREMVLTYQFGGSSSKGLPPGGEWRCFEVSQVRNAQFRDGDWHTSPIHTRPQTCVARVVEEVPF